MSLIFLRSTRTCCKPLAVHVVGNLLVKLSLHNAGMLTAAALCLIVGIADGDTVTARCGQLGAYDRVRVRMAAIVAPENCSPWPAQPAGPGKPLFPTACLHRPGGHRPVRPHCGKRGIPWTRRQHGAGKHWQCLVYPQFARAAANCS